MQLEPGTVLGHYRIEGPIGAGGMGEVYRATDSRLDREVAVKILTGDLTNESLRQRFEREAKLVSGLRHPNICVLHDIGREKGVDYLVMELLEGETLSSRLAQGPVPLREALTYGMEIADALDKVHRSGIVHRDLKPGNIMLTREGVKVLDFGLAKGTGPLSDASSLSAALTQTGPAEEPLTGEGTIIGTLQYMSPEQLEGREADSRADLFALGAILYEMATGQTAFQGDSQASLIASIMAAEPRPLGELQPQSPPALERLVSACLAKKPDDRIQSAHDLRLQLSWIRDGSSDVSTATTAAAAALPAPKPTLLARLPWLLTGILALALVAVMVLNNGNETAPPAGLTRLTVVIPEDIGAGSESESIALSPDGTAIAFLGLNESGESAIWVRRLAELEPERLPGTEGGLQPFWSPDGRHIGFFVTGKLMRIPAGGDRPPQAICDADNGRGGSWASDGTIVFAPFSQGPMYTVPASGGIPRQVTVLDTAAGEAGQRYPQLLPDEEHFLYVSLIGPQYFETRVASIHGGAPKTLLEADGIAEFASTGHLIYEQDKVLFAVGFDPDELELVGEPQALKDVAGGERNYLASGPVSTSRNGAILYHQNPTWSEFRWLDSTGRNLGTVDMPAEVYGDFALSPDGRRLVTARASVENGSDLWMVDLERLVMTRLTLEPANNVAPRWSMDGERLAFSARRGNEQQIFVKDDRGTGPARFLMSPGGPFGQPWGWSPNGSILVYRNLGAGDTFNDIHLYHVEEKRTEPFLATRFDEREPSLSPDGRWMAYRSNETGPLEVFLTRFPNKASKIQVSTSGGRDLPLRRFLSIFWHPDGTALVYVAGDNRTLMRVDVDLDGGPKIGQEKPLFQLPTGTLALHTVDLERFLVQVRKASTGHMVLMTNWAESLGEPAGGSR